LSVPRYCASRLLEVVSFWVLDVKGLGRNRQNRGWKYGDDRRTVSNVSRDIHQANCSSPERKVCLFRGHSLRGNDDLVDEENVVKACTIQAGE